MARNTHGDKKDNEVFPLLRRIKWNATQYRELRLLPLDGRERWTPRYLVIAALLMACLGGGLLVDRFATARRALVRMYLTRRRPGKTYQGFTAALQKFGDALLAEAVRDGYQRRGSKKPIDWAHKKREKPPGDPRCRKATKAEIKAAREL